MGRWVGSAPLRAARSPSSGQVAPFLEPDVIRIPGSTPGYASQGYLVRQGARGVLVDVMSYSEALLAAVKEEAPEGVSHLLLTHDDIVGASQYRRWREAFPSMRVVASPLECKDSDQGELPIRQWTELPGTGGFAAAAIPGHSRGHLAFKYDLPGARGQTLLFTGDSLGPHFNHYSLEEQEKSLRWLGETTSPTHVLPTHCRTKVFQSRADWLAGVDAYVEGLRSRSWPSRLGFP